MKSKIERLGKVSITVEKDYWDKNKTYNRLTIVERQGTSTAYLSRKVVPIGVDITNRNYWITISKWADIPYEIVQDFGDSTEVVISQKVVTLKINELQGFIDDINEIIGEGGSIDERFNNISNALDDRYTKEETYSKEQVNNLITTPEQQFVTVEATSQTTDVTDVLPNIGSANTIYRVGNWDGTQYDIFVYSEYSWDGTNYIFLRKKEDYGDGVFDVSVKYPTSGVEGGNTYTLEGALAVLDTNLSASKKKGGMSIMFIRLIPATYTVVKTEGVETQPTGTEVQEALSLESGIYTAAQMTGVTPPASSSITYYLAVTVDETTTYTTWVITKATTDVQKYVHYRYMKTVTTTAIFTNIANWQGVDNEPIAGSKNLVESGGVKSNLDKFYTQDYLNKAPAVVEGRTLTIPCSVLPVYLEGHYIISDGTIYENTNHRIKIYNVSGVKRIYGVSTINASVSAGVIKNSDTKLGGLASSTSGSEVVFKAPLPNGSLLYVNEFNYLTTHDGLQSFDITFYKNDYQKYLNILEFIQGPKSYHLQDLISGGYIKSSSGNVASNTSMSYSNFLPVVGGSKITCNLGVFQGAAIAFYSSDNESDFISADTNGNVGHEVEIDVPQNATYLRFSTTTNNIDSFLTCIQVGQNSKRLNDIETDLENVKDTLSNAVSEIESIDSELKMENNVLKQETAVISDFHNTGYINSQGVLSSNDDWGTTDFLPIEAGTIIRGKLSNASAGYLAFYTNNNESSFLSARQIINKGEEAQITVPSGATYFRACTATNTEDQKYLSDAFVDYYFKDYGSKRLYDIERELEELENTQQQQSGVIVTSQTWISIGDSITWLNDNGGIGLRPDHGYQYYLQQKIQFGGFTNQGVNGAKMVDYPYNSIQTADIYTIALGVNDWTNTDAERGYISSVPGTLAEYKNYQSGDTADTYAKALKRIILKIRSLNSAAFIILMTPRRGGGFNGHFPDYATEPNNAGYYLHNFADLLKEVADYEGLPVVDHYYRSGINDSNLPDYTYDGLHPNEDGMKLMAKMIEPIMKTVIIETPTNS